MHSYINKKVLLTTQNWFYAPDGKQYRAVWGTMKGIHEAGKTLGFIPNRSHANWFIEIGNMTIMGCQVMYIIQCDEKPVTERVPEYVSSAEAGIKEFERPSVIYIADSVESNREECFEKELLTEQERIEKITGIAIKAHSYDRGNSNIDAVKRHAL